jgi:F-box protein 6
MGSNSSTKKPDFVMDWDEMQRIIPEEVLMLILSHVPAKDLIRNCRLVCKSWKQLVDENSIWTTKYERDYGKPAHHIVHKLVDIKKVYMFNTLSQSLTETCPIQVMGSGNGQVCKEQRNDDGKFPGTRIPAPFPESRSVWAGSYNHSGVRFTIDLLKLGLTRELLDTVKPPISVSLWTAARTDCGSVFKCTVWLDADAKSMQKFRFGQYTLQESGEQEKKAPEVYSIERRVGQWSEGKWYEACHTFNEYKAGIAFIHCVLEGKDTQFWAGNFGPKFTIPDIRISIP